MSFEGPAEIVEDKYTRSIALADAASQEVKSLTTALNESIYSPPTINVQWQTLPAPNLPPIPNLPQLPSVNFSEPDGPPGALSVQMGDVRVDDFAETAPVLDFGVAPELHLGSAPTLPQMREVELPSAPEVTLPGIPEFLQISTHTFNGVDLHEGWLDKLDDIPELSIMQPASFAYSPGARYGSALLERLKDNLNARILGGTGLSPAVEQALWDRARDRETSAALAREQDVMRSAESLGFPLPSGVLAGQLADARREYYDKLSSLGRDIALKQADLEQQNLKDSVQAALQLETVLMDDAYKLENLAFEAAKAAADNAIAAHNAALEHYKALLAGYQAYAAAYETIVRAEMNKVEVFKALLAAEQIKADINKSLVDRYRAEIDGRMAVVEIYKTRVAAAQTLVELERTRIQAGGEEIKAFVATVNAETAKAELYKAKIGAESTKADVFRTTTQAYAAKVGAQAERARVEVAKYQAYISAKQLEWDGWKARLQAQVSKVDAAARQSSITVDGYRLGAHAAETQAASYMERWKADIAQYSAGKQLTAEVAKANQSAILHTNDARMEAAKVGLASGAQRLASAWAMVSTSASISGSDATTRQL